MKTVPTYKKFREQCPVWDEEKAAIEFAQLHVTAALEAAAESVELQGIYFEEKDKRCILNSYSLNNIK